MAEGAQVEVEAGNSSINKKPATECVWDIRYFQNQFYASNLACIECGHVPKRCYMDKDNQTLCQKCSEPFLQKNAKIDPNPYADGLVNKAEIACKNVLFDPSKANEEKKEEPKQCEWKGVVKDWKKHNDTDCQYAVINCNDCCEYQSSRSLQPAHHGKCDFAVIKCPLECNGDILRKDTKGHTEQKCPKTVMNCTNAECKEQPLREVLNEHVTQLCPKRIVECKYSEYGCTQARVKHEEMENHMQQFETKHIQFQLDRLYQMMKNNQEKRPEQKSECEAGMIRMFCGSMVPNGWVLCDGKYGTPDLRDNFILKNGKASFNKNIAAIDGNEEEFEISEREYDEDEEQVNDVDASPIYSMVYIMKS